MRAELEKVVKAVETFYAAEGVLFDKDLGERTLTHRMAVHLERQFDGWEVDCDYNRLGERLLKLPHGTIVSTDDELGKSVFPDIVVQGMLAICFCSASNFAVAAAPASSSAVLPAAATKPMGIVSSIPSIT